jgi:hypothetical protein
MLLEQARRIRWVKLVTRMMKMRNLHNIFMGENNEGKQSVKLRLDLCENILLKHIEAVRVWTGVTDRVNRE